MWLSDKKGILTPSQLLLAPLTEKCEVIEDKESYQEKEVMTEKPRTQSWKLRSLEKKGETWHEQNLAIDYWKQT